MAIALLIVFAAAKALAVAGHHLPLSFWTPVAYFREDAAVVLAFAVVARIAPRVARAAYVIAVAYTALNVPIARVASTPLTPAMWRAARGPLADSILLYLTPANVTLMLAVCGTAAIAPRIARTLPWQASVAMYAGLLGCVILGPAAAARVDTSGRERNAWTALSATGGTLPRFRALAASERWQPEGFEQTHDETLRSFGGAARGWNVVLVGLESTAAQYLGLYGGVPDPAPNLSTLARSAIVFENAYAVYPESIKGLWSTLCSRYPTMDTDADAYANMPCRSIPAVLREHGYRTALIHPGRFAYLGMDAVVRNRGYDVLEDAGDLGSARESSFGADEPSAVKRILEWIDRVPRSERFFVTYLPIAGHHPYDTPKRGPFPDRDDLGRYRNALHYADAALGTLIEGLNARGLAGQTLWIVFGDHGEAFGQHDGNFGHTFQIYDENVRVPLVIAAPGSWTRQTRVAQVASLIDIAPTLLDLVALETPRDHQGRSLLIGKARPALFFADYSRRLIGLRDGSRKFIADVDTGRSRLFDLALDPAETRDVSSASPRQSLAYRATLHHWVQVALRARHLEQ